MRSISILFIGGLAMAAGCGGSDMQGDDMGDDVPPGTLDVRVPIPADDPNYITLVTPDEIIPAGEERLYCYFIGAEAADVAIRGMDTQQGQFGHHLTLLTSLEPKPAGTREDCTSPESMAKYRAFVFPTGDLPDGFGINIAANTVYVLQMHYVNTGEVPILVRDVARMHKIAAADVQTWVATMTTNDLQVKAMPGESSDTWQCTLADDLDLLLLGGHMHEMGSKIAVDIGPSASELQNLYLVDPWKPEYRDGPPITLYLTAPHHLTAGSVIRTTCTWQNTSQAEVDFPAEMCSAFGYLAGTQQGFHCAPEGQ